MDSVKKLRAYSNRDYEQEIACYDKVLKICPNYVRVLLYKGICLEMLSKYDKAIECYDKCLMIDVNNELSLEFKGICYERKYNYDNAISCYNKALEINPINQNLLERKAFVLIAMNKYNDVSNILSKIKPENEEGWRKVSILYNQINDFDNSIKCLEMMDNAERRKRSIRNEKFEKYSRLGEYEYIMQGCNETLKRDSSNVSALEFKARCFINLKKYNEAIKCYDNLLKITDNNSYYSGKTNILLKLKRHDEIRKALPKIKRIDNSYYLLSKCYLEIMDFEESLRYLNKIVNEKYFSLDIVEIYLKLNKSELALEYCNKRLKINPDDYLALCGVGDCYCHLNNFDKSLEFYNKAISLNKYGDIAYFKKAKLLIKSEKYFDAERVLLNMKHQNTYYHWNQLSELYTQLKDYKKALECIEKTINLNYNIEYLVKKAEILYNLKRYNESMEICNEASKLNSDYDKLIEIMDKLKINNSLIDL